MFRAEESQSSIASGFRTLGLIYHATVRDIRKNHGNAFIGLAINVLQTAIFVLAFYLFFLLLGLQGSQLRGDFLLYLLTGVFLFLVFNKSMNAVLQSEGPASPMMKHRTMNTAISICASALSTLYIQTLSVMIVLLVYHVGFNRVTIDQPAQAVGMFLLTWFSGASIGMVFLALKPWVPEFVKLVAQIYSRVNIFASGKMVVANTLPSTILVFFTWNPLFHCIDQMRGYVFINYTPQNSSLSYPIYVSLACLMLGLMGEFYTRKRASISWNAGR